jgi:hypothetical protein
MLSIITGAAVGILLGLGLSFFLDCYAEGDWETENSKVLISLGGVMGLALGSLMMEATPYRGPMEVSRYEFSLYSGFNDARIEGNFYLLTGSVNEEDRVFFWVEDETTGAIHRESIKFTNQATFYEEDRKDGVLMRDVYKCPKNWFWTAWSFCRDTSFYSFKIPQGSIFAGYAFK